MFDTSVVSPAPPPTVPMTMSPGAIAPGGPLRGLRPRISTRPASAGELGKAAAWIALAGPCADETQHVVQYSDGGLTHAPETILAYQELARLLTPGFTLLYLHRGIQAQCLHPLLPSLLHLSGHQGPAHALRCHTNDPGLGADVHRFARAITAPGGATLILDDLQHRFGAAHQVRPAEVRFHIHHAPAMTGAKT